MNSTEYELRNWANDNLAARRSMSRSEAGDLPSERPQWQSSGHCGMIRDQVEPGRVSVRGFEPTVEQIDFAGVAAAQDGLIQVLQDEAQLGGERLSYQDPRWSLVFKAGIQLVNGHCDQYLDALFRFNREQRAARQDLLATGAATAAIMGLTGVAGVPIAIVTTSFGLAGSLFDAGWVRCCFRSS